MRLRLVLPCLLLTSTVFIAAPLKATLSIQINSSLASPQPLGTVVNWVASAVDSNPNPVTYKFEVARTPYTTFSLLQDFSTAKNFNWVETFVEGSYEMRITARDYLSGESAQAISLPYQINSLVTGTSAVVTATSLPLVALFSAPTCPLGSTMKVSFQRTGGQSISYTDSRACHAGSMNFYIAGMGPKSTYNLNYIVTTNGSSQQGPSSIPFTTGIIPSTVDLPTRTLLVPSGPLTDSKYKVSLSSYAPPALPYAADLQAEVVWYSMVSGQLMRTLGETLLYNLNGPGTGTGPYGVQVRQQILREIDLAGNTVRQTNSDRVSEQLVALGTDPIARFNHDAVRLANGHTIALTDCQRAFPAGTQGSTVPIDIIGEIIVELDENFQVVWYWNAFDHDGGGTQLDINRAQIVPGLCTINVSTGETPTGCPPALLPGFTSAADWLHANCTQLLADGNLMLSLRNQNWIIKIDYENGAVLDGNVLWRMGAGGDFTIVSSDSYPWFSGQHEPGFSSATSLALFDNGNTRVATQGGDSRGMAFNVDETNLVVTTTVSADVGSFSDSQGSAQLLPNGNYLFQPGDAGNGYMQSLELLPAVPNTTVFNLQAQSVSYRTFRMPDMYHPPYGTAVSKYSPTAQR